MAVQTLLPDRRCTHYKCQWACGSPAQRTRRARRAAGCPPGPRSRRSSPAPRTSPPRCSRRTRASAPICPPPAPACTECYHTSADPAGSGTRISRLRRSALAATLAE